MPTDTMLRLFKQIDRFRKNIGVAFHLDLYPHSNPVVNGHERLRCISTTELFCEPCVTTDDFRHALLKLGKSRRIYSDAIVARAVEQASGFPLARSWDDVRLMRKVRGVLHDDEFDKHSDLCYGWLKSDHRFAERNSKESPEQLCSELAENTIEKYYDLDGRAILKSWGLYELYKLEKDLVDPMIAMMQTGIGINADWLEQQQSRWAHKAKVKHRDIQRILHRPVNLNDGFWMEDRLSDELDRSGLDLFHEGLRSHLFDSQSLRQLTTQGPTDIIRRLAACQRYKQLAEDAAKLLGSINSGTGRIHPRLDSIESAKGEFACTHPRLYGLDVELLGAIVPPPDHVLVRIQFDQLGMRVLAHFSDDRRFTRVFTERANRVDIQRRTTAIVLRIREADVTDEEAKRIGAAVDSVVMSHGRARGLSQLLDVPLSEARLLLNRFFEAYPGVKRLRDSITRKLNKDGRETVESLYGRRREIDFASELRRSRWRVPGKGIAHIIEGSANDIVKLAIARLHQALPSDCRILLPTQHAMLLEIPEHKLRQRLPIVREVLEQQPTDFSVPLRVSIRPGKSWKACMG